MAIELGEDDRLDRLLEGRAQLLGPHGIQLRKRAHTHQLPFEPGVIEEVGLLLKERLDFCLAEAQPDEGLEGVLHHLGALLNSVAFLERSALLDRVAAPDLGAQEAFFLERLIRLADGVERDVEAIAQLPGGGEGIADLVMARRNQVPKLIHELVARRLTGLGVDLKTGHSGGQRETKWIGPALTLGRAAGKS